VPATIVKMDMDSLLVIDDDPNLLLGMNAILKRNGYSVRTASRGSDGIHIARTEPVDLIICDLMMPPPNGFEVLDTLGKDPQTANIPFIFLSARTSGEDKVSGLLNGADDYIVKPFQKEELLARIAAILRRKQKISMSINETSGSEISSLRSEISKLLEQAHTNQEKFMDGLVQVLSLRDNETEGHSQRVKVLTEKTAAAFNIFGERLMRIRWGAILHDIGKVAIPDRILLKPGPLTDEERTVIMMHPQIAEQILAPLGLPDEVLEIPLYHHERWDGTGYPFKLVGENIPFSARIFAVVDVWDALTNDRPYRKAMPFEKARALLLDQAGKHFDPQVLEIFLKKIISNQPPVVGR